MQAAKPEILMLDEPFSALDAHLKSGLEQDLLDLFDEFAGTILYISHDIDEAFRFCDRIAVVDEGQLRQIGDAEQILARPATLATLKVSGVKNITPARSCGPAAPTKVEAPEWGLTLECGRQVPQNTAWLGVRATYLEKYAPDIDVAPATDTAAVPAPVTDVAAAVPVTDVAPVTVTMDVAAPATDTAAVPAAANVFALTARRVIDSRFERTVILKPGGIIWRFPLSQMPASALPKPGDLINIRIPPEHIYLVPG
jgi:ABC-type sulfate/molybdate transport systems ATPase subunit